MVDNDVLVQNTHLATNPIPMVSRGSGLGKAVLVQ